jgi:SAM-dependent methyltransferase
MRSAAAAPLRAWPALSAVGLLRLLGFALAGLAQAASIAWPSNGRPLWWLQLLSLAALVALLDWLRAEGAGWRRAGLHGWLFSTAWLTGSFWWLFISMHTYGGLAAPLAAIAVVALAAALGLYYAVACAWFVVRGPRGAPGGALVFAALWTLAELVRGSWFTGFPWGAGGYAHVDGPLAFLAPWIGAYGIGLVAVVTTGLVDVLPDLPGVWERWGRDVLHCPYCHGWEVRDRAIAILGSGPMSVHQALLFSQLSDDVTFFVHGLSLDHEQAEQLAARGIRKVEGAVASLEVEEDRLVGVRMRGGAVVGCDVVVVASRMVARAGFLDALGLRAVEHPSGAGEHVPADPTGRTDVPGVWVAGNVTDLSAQVGAAAAAGAFAGAQINADLVMEETNRAVEARRSSHVHEPHATDPAEFWEGFYGPGQRPWSGRPNHVLVTELTDHPAPRGTALDLGCGAGADAIWLAEQGWTVTGVDISVAALEHAAAEAAAAGVADRIEWRRQDLADGLPEGSWDLVVAAYLHSPVEFEREKVLRHAAGAVAPGGTMVVIGHQGHASPEHEPPADVTFPTADEVLEMLDLDGWTVERAEALEVTSPDGSSGNRIDNVVRMRRPTSG